MKTSDALVKIGDLADCSDGSDKCALRGAQLDLIDTKTSQSASRATARAYVRLEHLEGIGELKRDLRDLIVLLCAVESDAGNRVTYNAKLREAFHGLRE